jgi:hypothetical protein
MRMCRFAACKPSISRLQSIQRLLRTYDLRLLRCVMVRSGFLLSRRGDAESWEERHRAAGAE